MSASNILGAGICQGTLDYYNLQSPPPVERGTLPTSASATSRASSLPHTFAPSSASDSQCGCSFCHQEYPVPPQKMTPAGCCQSLLGPETGQAAAARDHFPLPPSAPGMPRPRDQGTTLAVPQSKGRAGGKAHLQRKAPPQNSELGNV